MDKKLGETKEEKLIAGYKKAMKDFEETENQNCYIAAQFIKRELDKRNIEIPED